MLPHTPFPKGIDNASQWPLKWAKHQSMRSGHPIEANPVEVEGLFQDSRDVRQIRDQVIRSADNGSNLRKMALYVSSLLALDKASIERFSHLCNF